jgi:serine/threonine protein kinase
LKLLRLFTNKAYTTSSAFDQITQQPVALKKIMKPFDSSSLAKRTYREIRLLKYLRHENVWRPDSVAEGKIDPEF